MNSFEYAKKLIGDAFSNVEVKNALSKFENVRKPAEWEVFAKLLEEEVQRLYQLGNPEQNVKSVYLDLNPTNAIYMNDFWVTLDYILSRFKLSVYIRGDASQDQVEIFFSNEESNYTTVKKKGMTREQLNKVAKVLQ